MAIEYHKQLQDIKKIVFQDRGRTFSSQQCMNHHKLQTLNKEIRVNFIFSPNMKTARNFD